MKGAKTIESLAELNSLSKELISEYPGHRIFILKGDLGAGKTTLIQRMVKNLGSSDQVSSPTFSIVNEYKSGSSSIYHFDLYRIEDFEELEDIGFFEYLDSGSYIFIEWPEITEDYLEAPYMEINIRILDDKRRSVLFLEH